MKAKNKQRIPAAQRSGQGPAMHQWLQKLNAFFLSALILVSGCRKMNPDQFDLQNEQMTQNNINNLTSYNTDGDFTIVVIPDTQYYVETNHTGSFDRSHANLDMFLDQTKWVTDHQLAENIAYVAHVGDITNNGDQFSDAEMKRASRAMYKLDTAGIAYGLAVGNHDQYPRGGGPLGATTDDYNYYFGTAHFNGKSYYGGHYGLNNNSHYEIFRAGGMDFIAIYIEYDETNALWSQLNTWADNLLSAYPSHKAIIVTHWVGSAPNDIKKPSAFSPQAQSIYNKLKTRPNLLLFFGGHVNGEGYRQDTYNGKTVKSFVSDYQFYKEPDGIGNGGNGYMRLVKISPANDRISIKTFSPYLQNRGKSAYLTDGDSQFDRPLFHHPSASRTRDFDNNGKTGYVFFSNGYWNISDIPNLTYPSSGGTGDIPVPADYDGDGKTEVATWDPVSFKWNIYPGTTGVLLGTAQTGDIPVPGDYNGDGRYDLATWRPSNFKWTIETATDVYYGATGDIPVPADYDGDGKTDVALWRPSNGNWYVYGQSNTISWGLPGDIPVPGDYNGDGIIEKAVWRPSNGRWYVYGPTEDPYFGQSGDVPAMGDYNGDGKTEPAVYRPSTHQILIYNGSTISLTDYPTKCYNLPYHIRKFFF